MRVMEQLDPVDALFARAKAANVPMYEICDRANVARSTPSRWKNDKNGATISTVRALDAALTEIVMHRGSATEARAA